MYSVTTNTFAIAQRVHNVFHHLADNSLPYDLWNYEAELAAIVYLLKRYPSEVAANVYARTVREYNDSNERIGVDVKPFRESAAAAQVKSLARYVDSFPRTTSASTIYRSLLGTQEMAA